MRSRFALCLCCLMLASVTARAGTFGGVRDSVTFSNHVDVRQAEGHPDRLGVDCDLRYLHARGPADATRNFSLQAQAKGYQAFDSTIPDLDNMTAEVSLNGLRYVASEDLLSASELERQANYSERAPENGGHLTPAEQADYDRIMRKVVHRVGCGSTTSTTVWKATTT